MRPMRVGQNAAELGRTAIERQGGRCYTPAALKVAAALPPRPWTPHHL